VLLADVREQFGPWGGWVCEYLRQHNGRATPGRMAVLAALKGTPSCRAGDSQPSVGKIAGADTDPIIGHLTAHELIRTTAALGVPLDETTIYRTVSRLEELDLIHHVAIPDRASRYGLNTPAHQHAICDSCGTLQSLDGAALEPLVTAAARAARLHLPRCGALTLHGQCDRCRPQTGQARSR
jgi:Fe2+ or Zn2+ uptake regulation protein